MRRAQIEAVAQMPIFGPNGYGTTSFPDGVARRPDPHGGSASTPPSVALPLQPGPRNLAAGCQCSGEGCPSCELFRSSPSLDRSEPGRAAVDRRLREPREWLHRGTDHLGWTRQTVSLDHEFGVLVSLRVPESMSDLVAQFRSARAEAARVNDIRELVAGNTMRPKRVRGAMQAAQPVTTKAVMENDPTSGRLFRRGNDSAWLCREAERPSATATASVSVRTMVLPHVASAPISSPPALFHWTNANAGRPEYRGAR